MKDYQEIIDSASEPLMRLFKEEAEEIVKRELCEGKPCPKLCPKAKRHVAMIVGFCWRGYARLN